jgi:hypothetical protein
MAQQAKSEDSKHQSSNHKFEPRVNSNCDLVLGSGLVIVRLIFVVDLCLVIIKINVRQKRVSVW